MRLSVLGLQTLSRGKSKTNLKFIKYTQSSKCTSKRDSSVSYASGVVTV